MDQHRLDQPFRGKIAQPLEAGAQQARAAKETPRNN
jgi:hypothetical protein